MIDLNNDNTIIQHYLTEHLTKIKRDKAAKDKSIIGLINRIEAKFPNRSGEFLDLLRDAGLFQLNNCKNEFQKVLYFKTLFFMTDNSKNNFKDKTIEDIVVEAGFESRKALHDALDELPEERQMEILESYFFLPSPKHHVYFIAEVVKDELRMN